MFYVIFRVLAFKYLKIMPTGVVLNLGLNIRINWKNVKTPVQKPCPRPIQSGWLEVIQAAMYFKAPE